MYSRFDENLEKVKSICLGFSVLIEPASSLCYKLSYTRKNSTFIGPSNSNRILERLPNGSPVCLLVLSRISDIDCSSVEQDSSLH